MEGNGELNKPALVKKIQHRYGMAVDHLFRKQRIHRDMKQKPDSLCTYKGKRTTLLENGGRGCPPCREISQE